MHFLWRMRALAGGLRSSSLYRRAGASAQRGGCFQGQVLSVREGQVEECPFRGPALEACNITSTAFSFLKQSGVLQRFKGREREERKLCNFRWRMVGFCKFTAVIILENTPWCTYSCQQLGLLGFSLCGSGIVLSRLRQLVVNSFFVMSEGIKSPLSWSSLVAQLVRD